MAKRESPRGEGKARPLEVLWDYSIRRQGACAVAGCTTYDGSPIIDELVLTRVDDLAEQYSHPDGTSIGTMAGISVELGITCSRLGQDEPCEARVTRSEVHLVPAPLLDIRIM